jgi:hypothetical protein
MITVVIYRNHVIWFYIITELNFDTRREFSDMSNTRPTLVLTWVFKAETEPNPRGMGQTFCTPLRCPTQEAEFSRACFYLDSKNNQAN